MQSSKTVVLLATLDTKGDEMRFVKELIEARGLRTLVVDTGVRGEPAFPADVSRAQVAQAAGEDVAALAAARDRGRAAGVMGQGAASIVADLHQRGELDGLLAIGGGTGSSIANPALIALPLGVPKMLVTVRSAIDYRTTLARKDVTVVYAVTDILGLNPVLRRILSNAAGAISGMVEQTFAEPPARPLVAVTSFGVTTPAAMRCRQLLLDHGFEVVVFPATGTGGLSLEELIDEGTVQAVLDLTTSELADELCGGSATAGPHRLEAAARRGIPQVVVPGAMDFVNWRDPEQIPARYKDRLFYYHTPTTALMRTTAEENAILGRQVGERVGRSSGPAIVLIPTRGYSDYDQEGRVFFDPAADRAFVDGLRAAIGDRVPIVEIDAHVNDPAFASTAVTHLVGLMGERQPDGASMA
ncbi:MAG: Tm-1-like ATP-binding domain-containing protein [Chloroflexota bacterium]